VNTAGALVAKACLAIVFLHSEVSGLMIFVWVVAWPSACWLMAFTVIALGDLHACSSTMSKRRV
jgi:hypothetical protein